MHASTENGMTMTMTDVDSPAGPHSRHKGTISRQSSKADVHTNTKSGGVGVGDGGVADLNVKAVGGSTSTSTSKAPSKSNGGPPPKAKGGAAAARLTAKVSPAPTPEPSPGPGSGRKKFMSDSNHGDVDNIEGAVAVETDYKDDSPSKKNQNRKKVSPVRRGSSGNSTGSNNGSDSGGDTFPGVGNAPIDTTQVQIVDDSAPGVLDFAEEHYLCCESEKKVAITVVRSKGSNGRVTVKVKTVDREAVSPDDYIAIPEDDPMELVFEENELSKTFEIGIIDDQVCMCVWMYVCMYVCMHACID